AGSDYSSTVVAIRMPRLCICLPGLGLRAPGYVTHQLDRRKHTEQETVNAEAVDDAFACRGEDKRRAELPPGHDIRHVHFDHRDLNGGDGIAQRVAIMR